MEGSVSKPNGAREPQLASKPRDLREPSEKGEPAVYGRTKEHELTILNVSTKFEA
jgi:hypothetical protein